MTTINYKDMEIGKNTRLRSWDYELDQRKRQNAGWRKISRTFKK